MLVEFRPHQKTETRRWPVSLPVMPRRAPQYLCPGYTMLFYNTALRDLGEPGGSSFSMVLKSKFEAPPILTPSSPLQLFYDLWRRVVPAIRALSVEKREHLRRVICGQGCVSPSLSYDSHVYGVADTLQAVSEAFYHWYSRRDESSDHAQDTSSIALFNRTDAIHSAPMSSSTEESPSLAVEDDTHTRSTTAEPTERVLRRSKRLHAEISAPVATGATKPPRSKRHSQKQVPAVPHAKRFQSNWSVNDPLSCTYSCFAETSARVREVAVGACSLDIHWETVVPPSVPRSPPLQCLQPGCLPHIWTSVSTRAN